MMELLLSKLRIVPLSQEPVLIVHVVGRNKSINIYNLYKGCLR